MGGIARKRWHCGRYNRELSTLGPGTAVLEFSRRNGFCMRSGRGSRALVTIVALSSVASFTLAIPGPAGASKSDSSAKSVAPSQGTFAAATTSNPAPADDRLLVTVDPSTSAAQAQDIATQAGATIERRVGNTLILDPVATSGSLRATAATIDAIPQVRAVESNGRLHAFAAPNDPLYPEQYGLLNTQPGGIRAESAWNDTPGTRDVVVGVLDSGILVSHPDLAANIWTNRTDINRCGYGTHGWDAFAHTCNPIDDEGHGTHVAGIVGATGNNGKGVSGVAQRASLMSLKMLDRNGDGSIASAIEAIDFGLAAKASGVNLRVFQASWGSDAALLGTAGRAALHDAISRADAAGILFVAASGNGDAGQSGLDLDQPGVDLLPCEDSSPNVVCVGATTSFGQLATFSNYGATAVDLAAPGDHILSTVPRGVCGQEDYCLFDGTSMAAPMVSGAAVDVLAAEPALNVTDLRSRLLASVDSLPSLSGKFATNGRLDVCKAIPNCDGRPSIAPTKPLDVKARVHSGTASLRWSAPDSNGNSFTVSGYEVDGPAGVTSLPFNTTSLSLSGLANNTNAVLRVRAVGTGGSGPWVTKTVRPYGGGYLVEGNGAATPVGVGGETPSPIFDGPSFPADFARGIAIGPEGTGGYIVDLFGGLHPFRIGVGSPLPPRATGGPYWPGWDIVRGVTVGPNGGGYVLDGYGGVHPFGAGTGPLVSRARDTPYWLNFDIARGVVIAEDGRTGYVADGYGGIHPFRVGSAALPPAATGGPYWQGWNIVRGITLVPGTSGGWILDGYGGLHPFGAGGSKPAGASSGPYWPGQDRARGVDL